MRTQVTRHPERQSRDRGELDAILDAGLVAHVGLAGPDGPVVLPFLYARDGDRLLLHGSTGAGALGSAAGGVSVCVCVTHLDGLVFAGSLFDSSANYRCAVVFGEASPVRGESAKRHALDVLGEHVMPRRAGELSPHTRKQLAATQVLAVALHTWSVKARMGGPGPAPAAAPGRGPWTGVLPLAVQVSGPVSHCPPGPVPDSVTGWAAHRAGTGDPIG